MANLKQTKSDVFSTISAARTMVDNYPKLTTVDSFSSINSSSDPTEFLIDLFKSLGSVDDLMRVLSEVLVKQLDSIELNVKEVLKKSIRDFISCNADPSLIDELFSNGIVLSLKDIDFLNLMRKDPDSSDSTLFYFDVKNQYDSSDFNAFLYYNVNKDNNSDHSKWGNQQGLLGNDIISITYEDNNTTTTLTGSDEIVSEILIIKVDNFYKTPLKLSKFNSDFIDTVKLFDTKNLISKIFEKVFGSLSASIKRTKDELMIESEIERVLNRLSNCDDVEIDDSYFTFSNDEYNEMLNESELRKLGVSQYVANEIGALKLTTQDLQETLDKMDNSSTLVEQIEILERTINNVTDKVGSDPNKVNANDKNKLKGNIIKNLIKEISLALTMICLSPKIFLLLSINMRLLGLQNKSNITDVMKDNRQMIAQIAQSIKDEVIDIIMDEIKRRIKELVKEMGVKLLTEQMKIYKKYLMSITIPSLPIDNIAQTF